MMDKHKSTLTLRPQQFVLESLRNGGNGSQAAMIAGYSNKGAHVAAVRLLRNSNIARLVSARSKRVALSIEAIKERYEQIAAQDLRKVLSWGPEGVTVKRSDDLDDDTALAVKAVRERRD